MFLKYDQQIFFYLSYSSFKYNSNLIFNKVYCSNWQYSDYIYQSMFYGFFV